MEQLNRIELRGNVGNARVQTVGDNEVVHFSLATNYAYKGKDGTPVIETTWFNCSSWAGREDDLSMYSRGTPLHVEGRLRNLRYTDASGCERSTLEIIVSKARRVEP